MLHSEKLPRKLKPVTSSRKDNLRQLAFDNSPLGNIIFTLSSGKIIMVNNAASKLLGYSKKILLTKNRVDIFSITENKFKKILKQKIVARNSAITVIAVKKGGNQFPCEMNYGVFKDADGVQNVIVSIADIRRTILKQLNIDIKKEKQVSDNIILAKTKQKNIDTKKEKEVSDNIILAKTKQKNIDTKKEKEVSDNIILAKTKQKKIDTKNRSKIERNIIIAKSKQKKIDVQKEKVVARNIVIAESKQKNIDIKKEKQVADDITLAQVKSNEEKLIYEDIGRKKVLTEIEANFKIMFNSSSDVLFDSDLVTGKVMINDSYEKEFGYKRKKTMAASEDWSTHIHPDDKKEVMKDYHRMLKSAEIEWKMGYRFLRIDGSVANVLSSRIILRDTNGKAYRMIGAMQDISKQKILEEKLEREIELKEKQIMEAAEDAKDTERSHIGKELHDNINQLLVASKLYLEMAKNGGKNSEMYLSRSSEYTFTAIEEIRKLSKGLTTDIINNLGLCAAIENISRDTMEINPVKIVFKVNGSIENSVNDKFKLNIYRIVQEQLNNILKHAKATTVAIRLLQDKKSIKLIITDNGIGFDTSKNRKGIGVANIKSRAASYNGTADFISHLGSGCILTATFSASDKLLIRA